MHQVPNQSSNNELLINPENTREDVAFEEEFRKWETQFEEWKEQNKNHPDKKQYKTYEKQFMDVRDKLLSVSTLKLL